MKKTAIIAMTAVLTFAWMAGAAEYFVAARRVNAVNEIAPTEATAAAIGKVAALVEEYKLVASQFKGKKKEEPAPEPTPEPEASVS